MTAIAIFIMGTLLILLLDYHLSYLNSILYHIWKELKNKPCQECPVEEGQ